MKACTVVTLASQMDMWGNSHGTCLVTPCSKFLIYQQYW